MSRRPRGNCPVCRNTLSLRWSGDIRVLRKHSISTRTADAPTGASADGVAFDGGASVVTVEPCVGSGRPAVGEVTELHPAAAWPVQSAPAATSARTAPERVASVA